MERIKVAVVGCGNIANYHLNGYKALEDKVEIYAFCDRNIDRAKEKAQKFGVPESRVFTDVHELVKLKEIDAVSVCTWNNAHAECTIAALNAGKHVICEKPMAMNAKEAQEMLDAAKKNNKLLMIGFVRRFGNDCELLKQFVDEGLFGDLYFGKVNYCRRNGCPGGWFSDKELSGGGPLIDLGVHVIDYARYVMGGHKPVSVYGFTYDLLKNRPGVAKAGGWQASDKSHKDVFTVEDFAGGLIRFDNGSIIEVNAAFSLNIKNDTGEMEFYGTKAGAKLNPELEIYTVTNGYMSNMQLNYPTAFQFAGVFDKEIAHFVSCITEGTICRSPAEDGVAIMKILDGIYESAKTGHEVLL